MASNGKLPWFPFNPSDFLSDDKVSVMSALEVGAYIRLLCFAWNSHPIGTLLASDKALSRLATLSDDEWAEHKDAIMAPFKLIDGRWHQKRMVEDGAVCVAKHRVSVESGSRGAQKRWSNRVPIASPLKPHKGSHSNKIENNIKDPPVSPKEPEVEIPLMLQTPEFLKEWPHMVEFRKKIRKPLTEYAKHLMINQCLGMGSERAVKAIRNTITCGYQKLVEPSDYKSNGHHSSMPKRTGLIQS